MLLCSWKLCSSLKEGGLKQCDSSVTGVFCLLTLLEAAAAAPLRLWTNRKNAGHSSRCLRSSNCRLSFLTVSLCDGAACMALHADTQVFTLGKEDTVVVSMLRKPCLTWRLHSVRCEDHYVKGIDNIKQQACFMTLFIYIYIFFFKEMLENNYITLESIAGVWS